jgi:hypothetical protein
VPPDLRVLDAVTACLLRGAEALEPDDQLDMLRKQHPKYMSNIGELIY